MLLMQPSPTCRQEGEGADRVGDKWVWAAAARGGHLPVLEWLRSQACPWDESACSAAAEGGQLAALQWLRRWGAPWDFLTCEEAAGAGHLEVLRWAHAQGCPLSEHVRWLALRGEHVHVLRWAADVGCPADPRRGSWRRRSGWRSGTPSTFKRNSAGLAQISASWPSVLAENPYTRPEVGPEAGPTVQISRQGEPPRPETGPAAGPRPGLV
jgi:hypothetical protein